MEEEDNGGSIIESGQRMISAFSVYNDEARIRMKR